MVLGFGVVLGLALVWFGLDFGFGINSGLGRVRLDLSLARGLDYYTGVIFEAKLNHKVGVGDGVGVGIGSIGGGGRYDNLIGMFGSKQIPAVGCSIGIERILAYLISIRDSNLKARRPKPSSNATTEANDATTQATDATPQANDPRNQRSFNGPTQASVLVATIDVPIQHKMRLCSELWRGGISAQMIHTHQMKPRKAIEYALDQQIPFVAFLGSEELKNQTVSVKDIGLGKQMVVMRSECVSYLRNALATRAMDSLDEALNY